MRRIFVLLGVLLLVSLVVGYVYGQNLRGVTQTPSPQARLTSVPSPTVAADVEAEVITAEVGVPVTLRIPSLGITTAVESVGLDAKKNMDVPKAAENVGWYNLGVKPGQQGNAVLAGHLDTVTGAPAVFYNLDDIAIGAEIHVEDEFGNTHIFAVTDKKVYPFNAFPLQEVFGGTDKYRLNLITCGGQFNNASQNYSHRTVVYSELVK